MPPTHDLSGMLEWRCIGPHRGGRVVAAAGDPVDPMTFYFGAVAGGVWKTTDGGNVWENISDGFFKTAAVGALAIAESDPNVIYVGTGEATIRGNVSHGDGVYKSTDAGQTWLNVGLANTRHIAKVRVHPTNPDLVYVAALGHAWGPNAERGVFRSKDGGTTWEQILFRSDRAGAIDLTMDPANPRILYAAIWEAQRYPHKLVSGGQESGIFKSTDGGDTWTEITRSQGLPKGVIGKVGLAVSPARAGRVWALVEAEDGGLFRSDDGGKSWQQTSDSASLRGRAWYYTHVFADPRNPDTCYVMNYQSWRSTDGGKTFVAFPTPHGDTHDLWIDPQNPRRMIEGNDGGACVSFNGGQTWSSIYNQPTAQFYHVIADNRTPYWVYGSQQDNSAIALPHLSAQGAINANEWEEPGGGESGYIAFRPDNPEVVFGGAIGSGAGHGRLIAYDRRTGQKRNITVYPEIHGMGAGAIDHKYRFQWTFPLLISRHDERVLYAAGNRLFRSTDDGTTWELLSDDLTRNDPDKLQPSGGPITRDNTGAESYCTIFALAESPQQAGVLWAGTDDGLIHLSRDGGHTWEDITPPADVLPEWALISIIEPCPHDPAMCYVAATRYKHDDTTPYLLKTSDWGKTWTRITNNIPVNDFTRTIRADPVQHGLLFAGTETGIYISFDDGGNWERLGGWVPARGALPIVPIHDLIIKDSDLVVATHGRSFWILDDITPLRELAQARPSGAHLFTPRTWARIRQYEGYGYPPNEGEYSYRFVGTLVNTFRQEKRPNGVTVDRYLDAGQNPPNGVIVTYHLPDGAKDGLTLRFRDAQGNEVKAFSAKPEEPAKDDKGPWAPSEAGFNRFVWDGRYADARALKGDAESADVLAGRELLTGPVAPPGSYTVELVVGGQTLSAPFAIEKDPRVALTQAEFDEQFQALLTIRDKVSETHDTVNALRDIRAQVDGWKSRTQDHPNATAIASAADKLSESLAAIEGQLVDVHAGSPLMFPAALNVKLGTLPDFVATSDNVLTQGVREAIADLSSRLDQQVEKLQSVVSSDLAAFNALIRDANLGAVVLPKELS
jgi:photosystem II stability/assembly factor-like uncharacterized protein